MMGSMAACRLSYLMLGEPRVLHPKAPRRRASSTQMELEHRTSEPAYTVAYFLQQGHTSSNKATPTSTRPHLLVVSLPWAKHSNTGVYGDIPIQTTTIPFNVCLSFESDRVLGSRKCDNTDSIRFLGWCTAASHKDSEPSTQLSAHMPAHR